MIKKFDYEEPICPLSDGKAFYYPNEDNPSGRIPLNRIIEKVDYYYGKNDYKEAKKILLYWMEEATALNDKRGQLELLNELIGFYRFVNDKDNGLDVVSKALKLQEELGQANLVSGATILINCATAYKAFGLCDLGLPLYQKAEEIYLKLLKKDDSRFGGLYNNMALTYVDLKMFDKAEECYYKSLYVMKDVDQGEAECAITYINLAHMYFDSDKEDKVLDCMEKAYQLLKSDKLNHNGYYAFVLDKCAPSFKYFGYDSIYEEFIKESKEIYERS